MRRPIALVLALLGLVLTSFGPACGEGDIARGDEVAPGEAAAYETMQLEGWTLQLDQRLAPGGSHAELGEQVLALLRAKLIEIRRVLPRSAWTYLQRVVIWVEVDNSRAGRGMSYHPSRDWLRKNHFNPEKAKSIELSIAGNFLAWADDQPASLLHEFAHAWHDLVLGFDEPRIKALWNEAVESQRYEEVLHMSGSRKRHYALTNHKEYFAEMTEAYYWTNDFYPFVRPELKEADPGMFKLLPEVWKIQPEAAPETTPPAGE